MKNEKNLGEYQILYVVKNMKWEKSIIAKIKKALKHGTGGVVVNVKKGKVRSRIYLDDDWEDTKVGLTDPD